MLYIFINLPTFFVLIASQFMQFAIVVERWIASVFIGNYESGYRKLGPSLTAGAVVITAFILLTIYYGEDFNGPHLNARWLSSIKDAARTNLVLMSLLALNFAGLALTIALQYLKSKRDIGCSTTIPWRYL
ncbi:hypothetical protein TELCIR_08803 [Teladorsagia circumcincta]|uniref:Uncharacterized protein n=1 Tax=Teladorsagia circumcincta TaxID=45464 RepID=A0A2G9UGL0_TELCI|nr:hypothetical protein TELCIR_08803 [Teladorsagia circumcincta]